MIDKSAVKKNAIYVGIAIFIGMFGWYKYTDSHVTTNNAYVQADIVNLSAEIDAIVKEVKVADNTEVKAGDELIILDDKDTKERLKQAQAELESAKIAVSISENQVDLQNRVLEQAVASVESAEVEASTSAKEFERTKNLVKQDYSSQRSFDLSSADTKKSSVALANAKREMEKQKLQLTIHQNQLDTDKQKLLEAEAAYVLAENNQNKTVIKAPMDGIVSNRAVVAGGFARAGSYLISVVPLQDVYVIANYKETQVTKFKPGLKVSIDIDTYPGKSLEGEVVYINAASGSVFSLLPPENATGNFTKIVQRIPVKIKFNNIDKRIVPGMSVTTTVKVQ